MNVHAKLTGDVADTIELMIARGRAASKTEAIRLAILDYREHHLQESNENEAKLVIQKVKQMEKEVNTGKRKTLTKEDVLKKYPHLRDV